MDFLYASEKRAAHQREEAIGGIAARKKRRRRRWEIGNTKEGKEFPSLKKGDGERLKESSINE